MKRVQEEFERVIKDLRPEVRFNIISYSKQLDKWRKELVPASDKNKLAAVKYAWTLAPATTTSFYDAVDKALDDASDLELIVVLSDGKPTSGKIVDQSNILKVLTKRNKFHQVSITPLGLDLDDQHRQFLKKLSDDNFGELWEIR